MRGKRQRFAHEIKYMRVNTSSYVLETLKLLTFIGLDIFCNKNRFVIMMSRKVRIHKFKIVFFRNERRHGTGNLKNYLFLL